jgi:hypothetical protein
MMPAYFVKSTLASAAATQSSSSTSKRGESPPFGK